MENLVPIKIYRVSKRGLRGSTLCLPMVWVNQNNIKYGDRLMILQSSDSSDLVIRIIKGEENE